ncbi:aldehyde ferredoxin oxidoreductase family protein [Chloroflexota bacterium]
MARGFMGKILWADLTAGRLWSEVLDEETGRKFLGGYGLGSYILFTRQKAGMDPLGPDSIFGLVTGMLTGTPAITATRYVAVGKSPLTGGWGDANSGGYFGPNLKFAGYDAVFFTGISSKLVYLYIDNGKAELRDASGLAGKDTFETEDILKAELGNDVEVTCVGPSGESVSLIAAVMNNKGRAAGRSGLGAVMGSKKLKAVAVKGSMEVPLADKAKADELRKKSLGELTGHVTDLRKYGTPTIMERCLMMGDSPIRNWGGIVPDFPDVKLIAADAVKAEQDKPWGCWRCSIACGGHMKESKGEHKYEAGSHKPEYETLAMFGSNCMNTNLSSIIKANDICNRAGLDTISAGSAIAFAIECYENGIITKADTDGVEMTWGNHKSIVTMTEKLARREGLGDILADGVKRAAERIGKGSEQYAMHINGQEIPAHDPKVGRAWGTGYRMDATPARHTQSGEGGMGPGPKQPAFDRNGWSGRGEARRIGSSWHHAVSATGICTFGMGALPDLESFIDMMRAVSGWDITVEELLKTGERINNVRQAFNVREGINPLEYDMPGRIIGVPPKTGGPSAGITVDEETLDHEYLTAMDWDLKTTRPSKEKLLELGLEDVAKELYK